MNDEDFSNLLESVKEAGQIKKGKVNADIDFLHDIRQD